MILRRAEPPQQVRVVKVQPKSNSIELNIQPPLQLGGLPLLEYLVKYEQMGIPNSLNTLTFPSRRTKILLKFNSNFLNIF